MNELKALRLRRNLSQKDMVDVVRQIYPKYDKYVQSKCEKSELYGVELAKDAMNALYAAFDPERATARSARKKDKHRLTCSIRARLETPIYEALQQLIEAEGHATAQEWLTEKVMSYLAEKGGAP